MRYMLINISPGALQIDLHEPTRVPNRVKLHRLAPDCALNIKRGESINILPHFGGSLERTHAAIKYSRDVLQLLKPTQLIIKVLDSNNNEIDVDALFSAEGSKTPISKRSDVTQPDMGQSAVIAAVNQHEAEMMGEANPPRSYTRYSREELEKLQKKDLVKLAKKYKLDLDKTLLKEQMIDALLEEMD